MEGYSVKILETTKTLTARERAGVKDTTNATSLDEATQSVGKIVIDVDYVVELAVHNEKAEDKDYSKFIVVDKSGEKYVTGSKSFITALREITDEMAGTDEPYQIQVYRVPSKNYKGKEFLTCSIV